MKSSTTLTIEDCADVLKAAGTDLALMGGQATAYWGREYASRLKLTEPVVSKDIDFWGNRKLLILLAERLKTKPVFPDARLMTVLSGLVQVRIKGEPVRVDVLHTVPGVDQPDRESAAVRMPFGETTVLVLDPVSMVACKFHNVENFDQTERNDVAQLKLCILFARCFVEDVFLRHEIREGLNYCKRLLKVACQTDHQTTIKENALPFFNAIPIDTITKLSWDETLPEAERKKLANFVEIQWGRLKQNGFVA